MAQSKQLTQHTPGPWRPTQDVGSRWHVDADYKGPERDYVPIADVKQGANDAALIAQAPEMYELLARLADRTRGDDAVLDIGRSEWADLCQEARRIKAEIDREG